MSFHRPKPLRPFLVEFSELRSDAYYGRRKRLPNHPAYWVRTLIFWVSLAALITAALLGLQDANFSLAATFGILAAGLFVVFFWIAPATYYVTRCYEERLYELDIKLKDLANKLASDAVVDSFYDSIVKDLENLPPRSDSSVDDAEDEKKWKQGTKS